MNHSEECFMFHDFNRKGIKDIMGEDIYMESPNNFVDKVNQFILNSEPVQLSGQEC